MPLSKNNISKYSLIIILIAMMSVASMLSETFASATNLTNILKQVSIVTICAFAQGMVIIRARLETPSIDAIPCDAPRGKSDVGDVDPCLG